MNGNIQSVAQVDGKVIVYLRKKEVGPLPQKINGMPIEYKIVGGIAPDMVKYFDQQPRKLREPCTDNVSVEDGFRKLEQKDMWRMDSAAFREGIRLVDGVPFWRPDVTDNVSVESE